MTTLVLEKITPEQTRANLKRWEALCEDPELAKLTARIETDRHGHIIMTPPPAPSHGRRQYRIGSLLEQYLSGGTVYTECPVSTADGVKAADVAWISSALLEKIGERVCFTQSPEICVEVLSPSNTHAEMEEKKMLYFAAGASEVWFCREGMMEFFLGDAQEAVAHSETCPNFPIEIG